MTIHNEEQVQTSIRIIVNYSLCHYCGACVNRCLENALVLKGSHLAIQQESCTRCGRCIHSCPMQALAMIEVPLENFK